MIDDRHWRSTTLSSKFVKASGPSWLIKTFYLTLCFQNRSGGVSRWNLFGRGKKKYHLEHLACQNCARLLRRNVEKGVESDLSLFLSNWKWVIEGSRNRKAILERVDSLERVEAATGSRRGGSTLKIEVEESMIW